MTNHALDDQHMRRAIELAARGQGYVEPNPPVGCVTDMWLSTRMISILVHKDHALDSMLGVEGLTLGPGRHPRIHLLVEPHLVHLEGTDLVQ